ncbi:MAG: DUF1538 domain-containing protein [Erysipelotrichaceae bacterium]|nr:DUF1538 domain-containing protein [Erysipelotrichaceae bacterium]
MLHHLLEKIKEAVISVLPLSLIIIIFSLTPMFTFGTNEILVFSASTILLIIGISLFTLGADVAMRPMGEQIGSSLIKTKKIFLILFVCFVLGLLITIAEPDLSVLANQVKEAINSTLLIVTIGIGVGLFLVLAVCKIIFKIELTSLLMLFYLVVFGLTSILIANGNSAFLPLSFDSGGVTTGPITVPFIMALGVGIAMTIGGKNASENSFGLIALCSVGPILALLLLGCFSKGDVNYAIPNYEITDNFFKTFFEEIFVTMKEVSLALILIVAFFLIVNFIYIKLPKKKLIQIGIGILYTFIGLVLFLTAVKVGYMPVGFQIGKEIAEKGELILVIFAFMIGLVVVLAEPAIHVLTKQVEDLTNGSVSKRSLLIALSVGVSLSVTLSIIRIIFDFSILYYLVPGYLLSIALSFFVPKIYTAIAFDSGGVASGPLTSSFILPFAIGACFALQPVDKILLDAFGVVSMVALTPLISIQVLGFRSVLSKKVKKQIRIRKINESEDDKIIEFN